MAPIVLSIQDLERDHEKFENNVFKPYRPIWDYLIDREVEIVLKHRREQEEESQTTLRRVLIALRKNKSSPTSKKYRQERRIIEKKIAKTFVENSEKDLQGLDAELNKMLMRTSILVAAATLLFAVFALKPSTGKGTFAIVGLVILIIALLTNATAFIYSVKPLPPPFYRARKIPYNKRAYQTTVAVSEFEQWALNCWLGERRTEIITRYKKAHAFAAPLLVVSALLIIPGLGLGVIFR